MDAVVRNGFAWGRALRFAAWGGAAALLALPIVAMQFTDAVTWDLADFVVMGTLLAACAGMVDRATRVSDDVAYVLGVVVAVGTGFVLTWVTLAVGIVGDGPANSMFFGVIGVAALGAAAARFRPRGMARAMAAAAAAQGGVAALVAATGWGFDAPPGPAWTIAGILFFAAWWLAAAGLFRIAAR